jgi:hypothetical protein
MTTQDDEPLAERPFALNIGSGYFPLTFVNDLGDPPWVPVAPDCWDRVFKIGALRCSKMRALVASNARFSTVERGSMDLLSVLASVRGKS